LPRPTGTGTGWNIIAEFEGSFATIRAAQGKELTTLGHHTPTSIEAS
jgi:hypothetical protein